MIEWADPWAFALLLLPVLLLLWYLRGLKRPAPTVLYPPARVLRPMMGRARRALRHLPAALRLIAILLLVVALARPRKALEEETVPTRGIDIVIALDISTSMLAQDLKPNRVEAAKQVAEEFIAGRTSDRIGLVMFAGEAYTWCPLTLDYNVLVELMKQVQAGTVTDGTGIGKAIATGANRLRSSDAKSRVLILLTDGVNNVDQPDPLTAARAAAAVGIKIYTIGIGTRGTARAPVQTPFGIQYRQVRVEIDEELLQQIAEMTGGRYFRATSADALRRIYKRIDEMETSRIEVQHLRRWRELFRPWAALALLLLLLERLLALTWLRNPAV